MNDRKFRWGIREKLTLLFFGVTLIAVTVNFLMVVPRLEQRLRSDRIRDMREIAQRFESTANGIVATYDTSLVSPSPEGVWGNFLGSIVGTTGVRAAVLKFSPSTPLEPEFVVVYDPTGETSQGARIADPVASRAVRSNKIASGVTEFGTGLHAESAAPLTVNGNTVGAITFTTSLAGVTATVQQVARRSLIAAIIALGVALIAGLVASSYMARRLRRLETAAKGVSLGNFTDPIPIDSQDEIGEVARAFNTMQHRLSTADRARKAFIANASHELRTPLFSLGGYVELMREEDLDDETQREFLDVMHVQIKRMTKLATDLLDLSKIDTGSLAIQPERVDLRDLARGIAREFEPQTQQQESEITIDAPEGVKAYCDPDRAAQIVRILVDNALSHTPDGTHIWLDAEVDEDRAVFTVRDDGPGIPPEDVDKIFDRFHTGDKTGGTGLGLSIAREIATAMNGSLSVATGDAGTTFTLRLPLPEDSGS